jgi:hypothetical protein
VVVDGEEGGSQSREEAEGEQSDELGGYLEDEFGQPNPGLIMGLSITKDWRGLARMLGIGAVLGTVALGVWGAGRWWVARHFAPAAWTYARLTTCGRWLSCPLSAGQTPHQYAQELARVVPQGQAAIEHLVGLYVAERFGQRRTAGEEAEEAWRSLRPILLTSWARQRWVMSSLRGGLRVLVRASGRITP